MELKRRLSNFEKMIAMGEKLLTTFDVVELLDALVEHITQLLQAEGATLYLVDPVENRLISQSIQSTGVKEISLSIDNSSIAGCTAVSRKSLHIVDAYADLTGFHPHLKFNHEVDERTGRRTRNIITHPLLIHDELIGVFQVVNKLDGAFDEDDQVMLRNFSIVAGIAIMNARLMEKVMEAQASSQSIIENISDMVVVQNREGLVLYVNRSAVEFLRRVGRSENVAGLPFSDAFPEFKSFSTEVSKMIDGNLDKLVSNGRPSYVILSEKNLNHKVDKVILIIRNMTSDIEVFSA